MARILVTGASGLLGAHLMAGFSRRHCVVGVDRHPWWGDQPVRMLIGDLTEPGLIQHVVESVAPEMVIHCAAMVDVDASERRPTDAFTANGGLTRALVRALPPACVVVYISTDSVFQGEKPCSTEEEPPRPRTAYGRSKLQGEWEVEQATTNHLIVRTNFYGWSSGRKKTFGEWLYHSLETRQPMTLFRDVFFSPVYVVDFMEGLVRLIEAGQRGLVHLGGRERVSKHQFGMLMAREARLPTTRVRAGTLHHATLHAPRPKDTSLNSERFQRFTGMEMPTCRAGVRRFLRDRGRALSARFEHD